MSATGPVPGARVKATPRMPGEFLMFSQPPAITDADGRFRFTYPRRAAGVDLSILPPGFAAQARFIPSPLPETMTLSVAQEGGTLVLDLTSFLPSLAPGTLPPVLLLHGDARLTLSSARSWARLHKAEGSTAGTLVIPQMAPGSYTLCLTGGLEDTAKPCAQGVLQPYGRLMLRRD